MGRSGQTRDFETQEPKAPRIVASKYELLELLGRGAMGSVYKARHVLTKNLSAVKLVSPQVAHGDLALQRFLREISLAAKIGHDGIVKVFDAGTIPEDGTLYLSMELLEGETLRDRSERPGFNPKYGLAVVRAALMPLAAAHAEGVVHRDIKPDNIFIQRVESGVEKVRLLDFGIARDLSDPHSGTRSDMGLGTPHYMSPEQVTSARSVTPAADVWAIGVIMYWVMAGKLPFERETVYNTLEAVCTLAPEALSSQFDGQLVGLVMNCLDKDAESRPRNAGEVLTRLEGLSPGATIPSLSEFPVTALASFPALARTHSVPRTGSDSWRDDTAPYTSTPKLLATDLLAPASSPALSSQRPRMFGREKVALVVIVASIAAAATFSSRQAPIQTLPAASPSSLSPARIAVRRNASADEPATQAALTTTASIPREVEVAVPASPRPGVSAGRAPRAATMRPHAEPVMPAERDPSDARRAGPERQGPPPPVAFEAVGIPPTEPREPPAETASVAKPLMTELPRAGAESIPSTPETPSSARSEPTPKKPPQAKKVKARPFATF